MTINYRDLLDRLVAEQLLSTDSRVLLEETVLHDRRAPDDASLAIALVAGLGAWLTSIFVLMLLGLAGFVLPGSPQTAIVAIGVALAAGAIRYQGLDRNPFGSQLMLAASFAAQAMALLAVIDLGTGGIVAVTALFSGTLYAAIGSDANRFVSAMFLALVTVITTSQDLSAATALCFAASVGLPCVVFGARDLLRPRVRLALIPAAHVAAVIALGLSVEALAIEIWEGLPVFERFVTAIAATTMIGLAYMEQRGDQRRLIGGAVAIGALGLATTPGVLVALLLAALGLWRSSAGMTVLGVVGLIGHISIYYYDLEATLLLKSGVLLASGLILLLLRATAFRAEESTR